MSEGIFFINCAFVLYTVGVWSEKIQGKLQRWHLILFWLGIICDLLGTVAMEQIAQHHIESSSFHSITGVIALVLMLLHSVWATFILIKKEEEWIIKFHRYSLVVWVIWLFPFVSGALFHMM